MNKFSHKINCKMICIFMLFLTILLSLLLSNFDFFVSRMVAKMPVLEGLTTSGQNAGSKYNGYISPASLSVVAPIIYDASFTTAVQITKLTNVVVPGGGADDVNIATIMAKGVNSNNTISQIMDYVTYSLNAPIAPGIGPNGQNYNVGSKS